MHYHVISETLTGIRSVGATWPEALRLLSVRTPELPDALSCHDG